MKGKTSNIFMFILLGLLILGLAGFGVSSFGGSNARVGSVGDVEITVDEYGRALQGQLRAAAQQTGRALPMAEARAIGLDRQVLAQLVNTAAIDNEAAQLDLSVGDTRVAEQIRAIPAFSGLDGSFDREAYSFTLQQNGLSPEEFEANIRKEAARALLQGAVVGGLRVPATHGETLYDYIAARRDFTWTVVTPETTPLDIPAPTEAELRAQYEANPGAYTVPETRAITYVLLSPDMMLDAVAPSEEELRAAYAAREAEFVQPERRLVDRLVFGDTAEAEAAKASIEAGEQSFDALLEARGLTLDDVDQGEVRRENLPADVADAVFGLADTGIVGPLPSPLGPALYRVNGLLAAQITTFEEVRDELTEELAGDTARRAVAAEIEALDDLLAGGATLEELAADTPAELGTLAFTAGSTDGLAANDEVRVAAQQVRESDFPEIQVLEDGSVFALRLDEIIAPRLRPLDEVRDEVTADWRTARQQDALMAEAAEVAAALERGDTPGTLGLEARIEAGLTREAFIDGTPPALVTEVFTLENVGDTVVVPGTDAAFVARLDAILSPDESDPDAEFLQQVLDQSIAQSLAQDIFTAYAQALQAEAGITINQSAINAVQAQFP